MILEGKRILVTGIVNRRSIAFAIADRAQRAGADVLLTSFGRVRRLLGRRASWLWCLGVCHRSFPPGVTAE